MGSQPDGTATQCGYGRGSRHESTRRWPWRSPTSKPSGRRSTALPIWAIRNARIRTSWLRRFPRVYERHANGNALTCYRRRLCPVGVCATFPALPRFRWSKADGRIVTGRNGNSASTLEFSPSRGHSDVALAAAYPAVGDSTLLGDYFSPTVATTTGFHHCLFL